MFRDLGMNQLQLSKSHILQVLLNRYYVLYTPLYTPSHVYIVKDLGRWWARWASEPHKASELLELLRDWNRVGSDTVFQCISA